MLLESFLFFFFFSSRRRHTRYWRDWSSDVCSSDLSSVIQKNWQDLIKPQRLDVQPGRRPDREATIVVEPLERGFGITLGNALRRVLLSSLQGAAITQIQIDGVLHEFSSIAGVREDVTDIVLNLKALGLRMHSDLPKRMHLKVEGPCIVTAGMI